MTKWRLAAIGAGVSLLAGLGTPASAAASSGVIVDADGHGSFDPSEISAGGQVIATTNDGSSESSDLLSVELETYAEASTSPPQARLRARVVVDGRIPGCPVGGGTCTEGPGLPSDFDGPDPSFVGGSYKVMFQNKDKMHNGDNTHTGCARVGGGRVRDQGGHWADGYHQYIGLAVTHDGAGWSYTPEIGEYDPSPDGAFFFTDLESEPNMSGRFDLSVTYSGGNTTIEVEVSAVVKTGEITCVGGVHDEDIAASAADGRPGPYTPAGGSDRIANVSGLSTVDQIVVLPVAVPLSLVPGESDLKAVGGFIYFSDNTNRQSAPSQEVYFGGEVGVSDTLGDGPTCPTSTFGGTLPDNPLWVANQNQPCQIDDDAVGNTLLSEFRTAGFDFTANFS